MPTPPSVSESCCPGPEQARGAERPSMPKTGCGSHLAGPAHRRPPPVRTGQRVTSARRVLRCEQLAGAERQPELHPVEAGGEVAARELLHLAHPVAERVPVHEQLRWPRVSHRALCCEERAERGPQLAAVLARRRRRAARGASPRTPGARPARPSRAGAGTCRGPRTPPSPSPRAGRPAGRTAPRAGCARRPSVPTGLPSTELGARPPRRAARRSPCGAALDSRLGSARRAAITAPAAVGEIRYGPPARDRWSSAAYASAGGVLRLRAQPRASVRRARNPNRASPRAASFGARVPAARPSKKSPCSRRSASATARDFASSIANRLRRVAGDDPVDLAERLGLARPRGTPRRGPARPPAAPTRDGRGRRA